MKNTAAQPLIIKKYENRRLYNTVTSQYINQEQVAQLVRDGYDVRVIDAANGEDITRLVLAQIVLEDAKTPNSVFPLDVLRQMVVASGKATQDSALRYIKSVMDMYQSAYRSIPTQLNPFDLLPGAREAPPHVAHPPDITRNRENSATPDIGAPAGQLPVQELVKRIEELEARLTNAPSRRRKSRKKKPRRKS